MQPEGPQRESSKEPDAETAPAAAGERLPGAPEDKSPDGVPAGPFAPLAGVRVLDFSQNVAGPYATQILGDLGADVIKVEPPDGDSARAWGPPWVGGESPLFQIANRNKRAVALDLKRPGHRRRALGLAAEADVVVEAYRRGVAERLGIGYGTVRAANPAVVYLSVTSHGPTGPLRNDPGYDPLFQARSGLMSLTGEPEGGPVRVGGSVVDLGTGVWAAAGVMGALMERERTGKGRHVTAALLDTALALVSYQMTGCLATGEDPPRMGTGIGMIAPYQAFPCGDGGAVMIAGGNDRVFVRLCKALGVDDLAARPEYAENAGRVADRDRLAAAISERTRRMSADALLARLRERRVPAAPIHTVSAAAADPQTLATGMLRRTGHPRIDEYVDVALPLRWDGSRAALRRFPPRIGEHQAEVLEGDEGWPADERGTGDEGATSSDAGRVHAVSRAAAGPGERASAPQAWPRSFRTEAVGQLVATAAALGTRDPELVGESLAVAASRCDPAEVDELLLMSCFVTGFPAGLAALRAWADLRPADTGGRDEGDGEEDAAGKAVGCCGADGSSGEAGDPEARVRRGEAACRAVYGPRYEALMAHLSGLHPELPGLVVDYGYGALMSRPGLPLSTRELCLVAMLVPWGADPQLRAHLRGALETGASAREVEAAVLVGCAAARSAGRDGEEAATSAAMTWNSWRRSRREKASC